MRQNSNNFGTDLTFGEKRIDPEDQDTSSASTHSDNSALTSPELTRASGVVVTNDIGLGEQGLVAHDMSILAEMVTRRRAAKKNSPATGDRRDVGSTDVSGTGSHTFLPIRIAVHGKDAIEVVDSIEGAVEYLTTLWPVGHGEAFEGALKSCIDGIKGRASVQQVRSAFVNAAHVAGIPMLL